MDVAFSAERQPPGHWSERRCRRAVATIWDAGVTAGAEVGNVPAVSYNWNGRRVHP